MSDPTDRLEVIAAVRGTDPDIRWLLDEVLRLRGEVDYEHGVALELAQVALQHLVTIAAEVNALIARIQPR